MRFLVRLGFESTYQDRIIVYLFKNYWKIFYIEFRSCSFFQINIFFKVIRLATCNKIDELDLWFNHSLKFKDPAGHLGTWYQRLLFRGTQENFTKGVVLNGYTALFSCSCKIGISFSSSILWWLAMYFYLCIALHMFILLHAVMLSKVLKMLKLVNNMKKHLFKMCLIYS